VIKPTLRLLLAGTLLLVLACSPGGESVEISLLHFNDFHSQIDPYSGPGGNEQGGLARLAATADSLRALRPSLLLCAGDAVQGTPYYNFFGGEVEVTALNLMDLDAFVLGNHEFDQGIPALWQMVGKAGFPILSANLFVPDSMAGVVFQADARLFPATSHLVSVPSEEDRNEFTPPRLRRLAFPYAVFEAGGVRIGMIGATTEDFDRVVISSVSRHVTVEAAAASLRPWVDRLRPQCDLLVVLSHCGVDADSLLAARVPGIDIVVGGHEHLSLPHGLLVPNGNDNGLGGTLVLAAGSRGDYLGHLVLRVGGRHIRAYREALIPIRPGLSEDPEIVALALRYAERMGGALREVVGEAPRGMSRGGHGEAGSPLGVFVAEAMRRAAGADLALQNRGGTRADIPPGPVTVGMAFAVLPFENRIVRVTLRGDQVQRVLEEALARRGSLAGVTFDVENGRPVRVRVGGAPLRAHDDYLFATNDFCYQGGDGYEGFEAGRDPLELDLLVRDAFLSAVRAQGTIGP
jgi:2',3'-cyclic-nucleotide 2'-phosphodiesterase (5'-nucleotidase family)